MASVRVCYSCVVQENLHRWCHFWSSTTRAPNPAHFQPISQHPHWAQFEFLRTEASEDCCFDCLFSCNFNFSLCKIHLHSSVWSHIRHQRSCCPACSIDSAREHVKCCLKETMPTSYTSHSVCFRSISQYRLMLQLLVSVQSAAAPSRCSRYILRKQPQGVSARNPRFAFNGPTFVTFQAPQEFWWTDNRRETRKKDKCKFTAPFLQVGIFGDGEASGHRP